MCLALPMKIIEINEDSAKADMAGVIREISIQTLPKPPKIGDFVIVHAGFAIEYVDEKSALETLEAISDISATLEEEGSL
jgi:hydrogenase expression/formation protein HypC